MVSPWLRTVDTWTVHPGEEEAFLRKR